MRRRLRLACAVSTAVAAGVTVALAAAPEHHARSDAAAATTITTSRTAPQIDVVELRLRAAERAAGQQEAA
ncbi:MAG: hypothetical protein QOJ78_1255, partial [Pseudonocardiales bacterium]|nr:hypothetical protein [Pseudonocardiales bacterium]